MSVTAPERPAVTATGRGSAPPQVSRATRVGRVAWPAALVLAGTLPLATAWSSWLVTLALAAAAVVPLVVLRLVLLAGVSRWAATTVLVLLTVLLGYLLTSSAGLGLEQTVRDAVPRLLTSPRPYAVAPDLLVAPLLLTVLVSLLAGLRVESPHRVEPVAGAVLLYVAGMLLAGGRADPYGLVAVLLLVIALLGWVLLDEHSEPVRPRLVVVAPVAVVGIGLLAAATTVGVRQPFEPRGLVDPPVLQIEASNPLTRLGAWAENPDAPLMRVRGPAVPLRLVTLDDYDGRQWTAATRFAPLGTGSGRAERLPSGTEREEATVEVLLDGLGGNWLPTPGSPEAVSDREALVDPATGTVYRPGDTDGLRYEVTGAYDAASEDRYPAATLLPGTQTERWTELPARLPPGLLAYARQVAQGAGTPYERAREIEAQIRSDYVLSARAISGSALWRLEAFLVGDEGESGARIGTSEQFASAFAVVARFQGLPTRVVVGFRPGEPQDDGSRLVTGADAFAWPEVYFADLGWVPFSPTPDDDTFRHDVPQSDPSTADPDPTPTQETSPTATPSGGAPTDAASGSADGDGDGAAGAGDGAGGSSWPTWAPWLLAPAGLLAVVVALLLARAARRRRHLDRGAVGAWAEVRDAVRLARLRVDVREGAEQVAERLDARLATPGLATGLAQAAERGAFGPAAPAGAAADVPGGVPGGRRELRDLTRRLRRTLPRWRRWWWHLDPRVLLRSR